MEVKPAAVTPRNGSCDNAELLKAQKANEDLSRENKKLANDIKNFEQVTWQLCIPLAYNLISTSWIRFMCFTDLLHCFLLPLIRALNLLL